MGRPTLQPDRWRANVVLRLAGFSSTLTARLLGMEKQRWVLDRNYKRDLEKYFPDLLRRVINQVHKQDGIR